MGEARAAIALMIALAFAAASCSSPVTEAEAEAAAIGFVKERVKFFARNENQTFDVPEYAFESIKTGQRGSGYVVSFNVSSRLGNETKSAYLEVAVDSRGEVLNFQKATTK